MKPQPALDWLTQHFGIVESYHDLAGVQRPTSRETKLALLKANGLDLSNDSNIVAAAVQLKSQSENRKFPEEVIIDAGEPLLLPVTEGLEWQIHLETASHLASRSSGQLDVQNLPIGLHQLEIGQDRQAEHVRLIVSPKTAPSLGDGKRGKHLWGLNAALYGLHCKGQPGIGSFDHLAQMARIGAASGASFLGINPVHALGWNNPEIISPYSPTHRGFLNGLHIAADQIRPQPQSVRQLIADWQTHYQKSASRDRIDYAQHGAHLRPILKALHQEFSNSTEDDFKQAFFDFCNRGGLPLARFAQFEYLSARNGPEWSRWQDIPPPNEPINQHSHPEMKFHAWIQWQADQQLAAAHQAALSAGMDHGLYLDLAVGARRNGAEAYCEAPSIAQDVSVGAPPDHLSPAGQNWNLAAFAPKKLAETGYRAFRDILRQNMRHCGILRIDHVLGLNRSYWIPDDGSPGGYIRQNFESLMALIRIEAHRSNTLVVGEDLGLVPEGFRDTMNKRNIYSYGVLQYEKDAKGEFRSPKNLRPKSLVCFSTHDTPTLAGYRKARDVDWWRQLNWIDDETANQLRADRKNEVTNLVKLSSSISATQTPPLNQFRESVYNALAGSNAAMVSVQLDDLFGSEEAQNLPGTTHEHPNWQRRYPCSIEELTTNQQLVEMSQIMARHGRDNARDTKRKNVQ